MVYKLENNEYFYNKKVNYFLEFQVLIRLIINISKIMNNHLEQVHINFFPTTVHTVVSQSNQDPVSKLISSLYSSRGIEVDIKSKDDVFIEDFISRNRKNSILINTDEDLKLFSKPAHFPNFFSNKRQNTFPTQQQKEILLKLKNVPIYTVVNGLNEVIIASPRNMPAKSTIDWLYDKYYENFLWKGDKGAISLGLFFLNKEDAEIYLQEICKKDPKGAEDIGLSVRTVGLDTFYELNRTSQPQMQAKLIADLQEIDLLLNEYTTSKIFNFHPKQKYKNNWFQGNPVYIIKINEVFDNKKYRLSNYHLYNSNDNDKKILLFSKKDAERVWNLYRLKNQGLFLPKKPNLEIYNLENYLLDLEKSDINLTKKTIFVPPYESYIHSKDLMNRLKINKDISIKNQINDFIQIKLKDVQRFYKGVVWLLTSDTLPSEDNSW